MLRSLGGAMQLHVGDAVEVGRGDLPAERALLAVARVVDQHQQDVRGSRAAPQ